MRYFDDEKFELTRKLTDNYEYLEVNGQLKMVRISGLVLTYQGMLSEDKLKQLRAAASYNHNLHLDIGIKGTLIIRDGLENTEYGDSRVDIVARCLDYRALYDLHKIIEVDDYVNVARNYENVK